LKLKPRVWSSEPSARFNVIALKCRLTGLLRITCESSTWDRRLLTNACSSIRAHESPPAAISGRFTVAVASFIVNNEEGGRKVPP
jgi:hypothetical protein